MNIRNSLWTLETAARNAVVLALSAACGNVARGNLMPPKLTTNLATMEPRTKKKAGKERKGTEATTDTLRKNENHCKIQVYISGF